MKESKQLVATIYNDSLPQMRPYEERINLEQPVRPLHRRIDFLIENLIESLRYYFDFLVFDMQEKSLDNIKSRIVIQLDNKVICTKYFTFSGRLSFFINMSGIILEIENEVRERLNNELCLFNQR